MTHPLPPPLCGPFSHASRGCLALIVRLDREEDLALVGLEDDTSSTPARHYVCIEFIPWHYEGYDDVKAALMDIVLERLVQEAKDDQPHKETISRLRRAAGRLRRAFKSGANGVIRAAPAAVPAAAAAGGLHLVRR